MKTVKSLKSMQRLAGRLKCEGKKIAFVPTMGALHEGHLALIRKAKKLGDVTVVSIFVNPAQFGPSEDFSKYPRTFKEDRRRLRDLKVDYVFYPDRESTYPPDYETYVNLEKMSKVLEGQFRPIHFRGVATIVTKLLNIVQPDIAVFGQKDYQQSVIIKKMVRDLNLPVKIVIGKTVREESGLALSSRNKYLDEEQKKRATVLYKSLMHARDMIRNGERNASKIKRSMRLMIDRMAGTKIDYIAITDDERLEQVRRLSGKFTISLAVWLDEVRLIDNISVFLGDEK
ncbi:MAG TPA: pantoate--beta-alanine ligase [candidate division Zixibacteria bacterium]|nr:pantoate--beta-alanine ligase [candidate division Zixibacteria bacterium]HEQ99205.1 pantoate--beta-alanine ligase [candidate division Zixibacteria bacterium]